MENRDELIEDCRLAQTVLCDTTAIDAELEGLRREVNSVEGLKRRTVFDNAHTTVDQDEWKARYNGYLERQRVANERTEDLESAKRERLGRSLMIDGFIRDIENRELAVTEFDEKLWVAIIDRVVVERDGAMLFRFKNGLEVRR